MSDDKERDDFDQSDNDTPSHMRAMVVERPKRITNPFRESARQLHEGIRYPNYQVGEKDQREARGDGGFPSCLKCDENKCDCASNPYD